MGGRTCVGAAAARWGPFVVAVLMQFAVLYAPRAAAPAGAYQLDKLVHAAVFAAVALSGRRAGVPVVPLIGVLIIHAVVSEIIQAAYLPARSGDPTDVVADLIGAGVGLLVGRGSEGLAPAAAAPEGRPGGIMGP